MVRNYSKWIASARAAGMSTDEINSQLTSWMREDLHLLKGICPECGAPIRRAIDPSPRGATLAKNGPGAWVMYRCSRDAPPGTYESIHPCGYMLDRWEEHPAN